MAPDVSIIVPVYNAAPWIEKCLHSIVAQAGVSIEIIMIDDGSTDDSAAICQRLATNDPRIRIVTQVNTGQGAARNRGLGMADGRYILFVDSDDWIEPELSRSMIALIEPTMADFACFALAFRTDQGKLTATRGITDEQPMYGAAIFEAALLDRKIMTSPCNKLYRRSFLIDNAVRFPEIRAFEDAYFSRAASLAAREIIFSNALHYNVLVRPGSTSRSITVDHFIEVEKLIAHEHAAFAPALQDVRVARLFKAHIVKMISHILIIFAFQRISPAVAAQCYEIVARIGFLTLARDRDVLGHLSLRERAYAFVARHRHLARIAGRAGAVIGLSLK
jgi:glycosyltransferase EpsH